MEQIRGSRNGNDTLTGNAADNQIFAYGGDDILRGGAGNDTIFGGAGFDTVIINANSGAISVQNEASGWRVTSSDGSDLIGYDVEQFLFNDTTLSGFDIQNLANAPTDDLIIFQNDPVGGDVHFANGGNDTLDFTNIADGFVDITYQNITSGPIQVSLDAVTNTGSVIKADMGTDTFVNLNNAFGSGWLGTTGGLFIVGTALNDTFDITVDNSFIGLLGGAGNDIYNLDLTNPGAVRLDFRAGAFGNFAPQGLNVDLSTGVVLNDGFGSTDQINITAAGLGSLEIGGTRNTDVMVGSARNERFITLGGNDTVDGGGGVNTVRYDRPLMDAVNVNLATGIATGSYLGNDFTQSLINIQAIRGSRDGNDTITGNAETNILGGMGGDD
ncbi:MAG: calcium-binding protein, partial [Rhodobacterales bacterium]